MASSTLFRGRRIVDPVPVQRGQPPRHGKYQSSFSDLAAAWENVGEAKSALQAAEARINEANAGLGDNEGLDDPMEEVFSETQRYGRVARYELRPSHFGQDGTSVTGRSNSRRANDFRANTNRQELPSRAPVHMSLLSPPSKDIHDELRNGPMSRNPMPAFPTYPSDSGLREPGAATSYSSIHRTNESPGRRSPSIRFQGLSSIPSASSFDDSLEVGATSRLFRNESRPTSSLGLRPVIANNSDALARLKERIKLQKEQALRLSPTNSANGNSSSNPSPPPEVPSVDAEVMEPYRSDIDVPVRAAISKRKVASAPAAPAYKGFSEVESKATTSSEANRKVKAKGVTADRTRANSANLRPPKPLQKKAPPKVQRVIAPRRPTDIITISSWRTGQQTVKRILGPAKKSASSATVRSQSSSSQDTDVSEPKSLNFQWKDDDVVKKGGKQMNGEIDVRDGSTTVEAPREKSPIHEEHFNGLNSDSEISQHSSGLAAESEADVSEKDMKDLKGNKMLSTEAKNILSDLELDTDDESVEIKMAIPDSRPKQSRVQKSSKRTQKKTPFKPQSQVSQQPVYPKQKTRHYDADEVKKYMAKQMAERKRKLIEDKLLKKRAVEEKKKKLEELYSRQKKNLQNNLHHKSKKSFGETYSKGHGDLRSIFYTYNHPFQQDEVECYSEDAGVSESDKENLDIASFRGLPAYPAFKRNGDEHHSLSSSPSGSMTPEPDQLSDREEKSQVPCVTSVSVGTKPVDIRLSAYGGFPEEKPIEDILATRSDLEPRSSSPNPLDKNRPRAVPLAGNEELKLSGSPPREDRIAAIKQTAAQLKQRLETEAWRLGLNLQPTSPRKSDEQLETLTSTSDYAVFKGTLPGVDNLREQAELNQELDSMTSAATTIQAAFRGHSVRQGLNWKLPSGRTLRSTVREGLHQRPRIPGAGASESSQYSTARDAVIPNEGNSSISDINTSYSSVRSNAHSPTHSSRSLKDDRSSSVKSPSLHESERRRKHITGHLSKHSRETRPSTRPWNSKGGDRLSVINIFTRRNPHLKYLPKEDESLDDCGSETGSLLEETLQDNRAGETASLLEPVADLDQSGGLLEQTLVEESPAKSKDHDEYEYDDFTGSSHGDRREGSEKRTPSPDRRTDEPVYSETFESPENKTSSPKKSETLRSPNRSLESGPLSPTLSPTLSEGELSQASEVGERSLTFSSTRRSPPRDQEIQSPLPPYAPPIHPPPSVFMPSHQGGDRLSPGSLDMRLAAELNRLEYMEESVRQLTDVERTRAVSMAQQETVSLAQILKSKQLSHARDMENLRAKAREEALEAAKQLEEARRAAADAAAGAAETISRVRLEAAANISESADRLVKVQNEAARTTAESAKHVEEARSSAARTLLDVARQQTADTRGVAADAASAAAEAAVKSTMARFHEQQQEQLLREREARLKSYRDKSRDERTRDSYSSYSPSERTVDTYSRTRTSRTGTDAVDRASQAKGSPGSRSFASDDLNISRGSGQDRTASVRTASNLSVDRSVSHNRRTPSLADHASRSKHAPSAGEESGSIPEEMEHSVADSVLSDIGLDVAEDDSLVEVLSGDNLKKPSERLERSPEEDYTLNFEESVMSSHTATDDEIDFRMILPSESHRRRSLGKTGRSGSIASDQGTVSYSSDDNHDSQDFPVDKVLEEFSAAPFSGEDSFSQFTSEMVRLMKEEEVRAKHQAGLLRLRQKALKEKTRAEMAWLECQKQRHRDKGADDVMPSIRKRQRGVLMRLQAEQAEIKRLKAANRAASYERRLLLMQQEEIARLRKNTKKIREKAATEQATHGQERGENLKTAQQDFVEQPKSEAESTEIIEEFEEHPVDHSTRSRSSVSEDIKTASPSASANASVAEELASYQSPGASRTETRASNGDGGSGAAERKRRLSEGDSDEGSAKEGTLSASKGSPTASDSTVMQKLKKLKNQSSERYLTLREQKLMKRRKEAENLLEDKKKLLEWEKRLDKEESLVRNLLNEALSLESSRNKARTTSITSEEEEHKDRSGRGSASLSASRSPSSKVSDKDRSPQPTESIRESIKDSGSRGHERSASESSVPEDISVSARDKSRDRSEKSHESSIPEVDIKTRSQGSSIPEEIPEEYVNDTFESLDSTATLGHSTPVRSDLPLKRDTSPAVSRRSSTGEGSKSEEETSMTETSDHSDIESRVRRLRDQLEVRKREVKRLYNERKKQRKAMLRAQEASLRQELQAVEMVISRTKAELNRPQPDSKRPETGSTEQRAVSTKSESSDTVPSREVRYHLSRTSDASGSRKYTPPDKPASVSARSEPAGGRVSTPVDADVSSRSDRTISDAPSLKEKEKDLSSASVARAEEETKSPEKSETTSNRRTDLDLADRTLTPGESFSANRRQPSESELRTSVKDRQDSDAEIEDEAKTAQDLSVSEESEVRTESKASYSEKSFEQRSQASSKSLPVSRGKESESDRKSSVRERSDIDSKIPDEAKTADDVSVSEVVSRSKSSRSESDGLEKSRGDRSSITSDRKSAVSEVSKSFRLSKSPVPSEKSRSSHQFYSSSFESVQSEGDKTEDDISEHISIEEDVGDNERSGVKDSVKDEVIAQSERDIPKDGERTIDITEVPEEISSIGDDRSEIKEDVPSTRKTVSVYDERSSLASQKSVQGENDLLRPEKNEDQFPSYSADFEPSAVDETDEGKSDNLIRQASYTPDFDASESKVSVEDEVSFQQEEKRQDLSHHSKKSEHSEESKGSDRMPAQKELHRDEPLLSKDQRIEEIPVVQLEQATDEESIAEELNESVEELEEIGDKEGSETSEKHDLDDEEKLRRLSNEKGSIDINEIASILPDVPTPEPQSKPSVDQTADRIVDDLSTMLLTESMNCVTGVLEKRRQTTEDLPRELLAETGEERSNRLEKEDRYSLEDDKDVISRSLEETSEGDKISDHFLASEGENSVSGLDFRTKEREDLSPSLAEQSRQETREERSNAIVNKLSDALLKEAASQMIAIMRSRQEKFAAVQTQEQSTDSYTPPKGKIEDEPHSGEASPSSPRSNRFMAVQRFPEGLLKYTEETSTPPGSPTSDQNSPIDEKELADKLDQLRRLHEHLDSARDKQEEDDDERLEFPVNTNTVIEFPAQDEDEDEESFRRSRGASLLFSVPHRPSEVSPLVASSLSVFFQRKRQGLPIDNVTPPSEIIGEDEADDDLEANSKRVYRRLVFDLTGSLLKELLSEEAPSNRPSWMKAKPRRKRRLHRGLQPLVREQDFLPVVEQQLLNLIGLGDARPSLERVRRKTPLKAGKKDFVDAILIQELREDEPLWIDYDDDELAVKFQVADAIFESLLSETVMVMNAVQLRREARADVARS